MMSDQGPSSRDINNPDDTSYLSEADFRTETVTEDNTEEVVFPSAMNRMTNSDLPHARPAGPRSGRERGQVETFLVEI
jgi:hypothetical protein